MSNYNILIDVHKLLSDKKRATKSIGDFNLCKQEQPLENA
jgi:hypothetical protein